MRASAGQRRIMMRELAHFMRSLQKLIYRNWQRFHGVRRLELSVLTRFLAIRAGERLLDLGSGKGAFYGVLSRQGHDVVGVDPSMAAVSIARTYVDAKGRFVLASGEDLPLGTGRFDRAVSVCVLEHTRDDAKVLSEVARVLKPGGTFALSVDCLNSPHVSERFRRHHITEYRCNQLYSDIEIRERLAAAGFEMVESEYLFESRLAIAILRFGSIFHYRGAFILLFPLLYPLLWLDHVVNGAKKSGMILAVKARKKRSDLPEVRSA